MLVEPRPKSITVETSPPEQSAIPNFPKSTSSNVESSIGHSQSANGDFPICHWTCGNPNVACESCLRSSASQNSPINIFRWKHLSAHISIQKDLQKPIGMAVATWLRGWVTPPSGHAQNGHVRAEAGTRRRWEGHFKMWAFTWTPCPESAKNHLK